MIEDIVVAFRYFINVMNNAEDALDPNVVREAVSNICRLSDVAKLVVTYYEDVQLEGSDNRIRYDLYEDTVSDGEVIVDRRLTDGNGLAIYEFFHAAGTARWSERIRDRLNLMISILFMFNSRQMLKQVANRFAYIDESGYHNLRYFSAQVNRLGTENDLHGKAVAHFNLRHFQAVNNQIGRKNGDIVMRGFVDGIEELTGSDIPVCRIGGDNFITIFTADKTDALVDFLGNAVISFGDDYGESIMMSATAGIFVIPDDYIYTNMNDLLDKGLCEKISVKSKTVIKNDITGAA